MYKWRYFRENSWWTEGCFLRICVTVVRVSWVLCSCIAFRRYYLNVFISCLGVGDYQVFASWLVYEWNEGVLTSVVSVLGIQVHNFWCDWFCCSGVWLLLWLIVDLCWTASEVGWFYCTLVYLVVGWLWEEDGSEMKLRKKRLRPCHMEWMAIESRSLELRSGVI